MVCILDLLDGFGAVFYAKTTNLSTFAFGIYAGRGMFRNNKAS